MFAESTRADRCGWNTARLVQAASTDSPEQFIRRMYAQWNAHGIRSLADAFLDAQVQYNDDAAWPGGGAHRGRAAVIARFEEVVEVLGLREAVVERVIHRGEEVAWVIRSTGRSPRADVPNDHRWGYTGRITGGKLVRFEAYYDADEAFATLARSV
ncbi:MAG TPA: nuclear transport factor 2 family protein [Solirubrobacteraceae bacterium]|jgi:ketosteroid isomerase-like protein|nr:nuclear transport factor 2 family protein [Solirubrobacteraceae bacterium]